MQYVADSWFSWLADYYLLSSALLVVVLTVLALLQQPARRLAVIKGSFTALVLLAILCGLPRSSAIHLQRRAAESAPHLPSELPASHFSKAPVVVAPPSEQRAPQLTDSQAAAVPTPGESTGPPSPDRPLLSLAQLVLAVSVCGTLVTAAYHSIGMFSARRLRRTSIAAPKIFVDQLRRLAPDTNVDLRTSLRISVPVAFGIHRPTILLPNSATNPQSKIRNPQSAIEPILAHELAHIQNKDLHWLAASRVLLVVLWANPLYYLLRRQMRLDQESLADAAAAALSTREDYAEQLITWARATPSRLRLSATTAVGLWESPSQLRRRIALLLNDRFVILRQCSRRWRILATTSALLLTFALSLITLAPAQTAPPSPDSPLPIGPSSPLDDASAPNSMPNTLAGCVTDENGNPLHKAEVFVFRVRQGGAQRTEIARKSSDKEGKFHFERVLDLAKEYPDGKLPPLNEIRDDYIDLVIKAPGRASIGAANLPQVVAKLGVERELVLPPGSTVEGIIKDPTGQPVSGALVAMENGGAGTWERASSSRTDATGRYTITDALPYDPATQQFAEEEIRRQNKEAGRPELPAAGPFQGPMLTVTHPKFATSLVVVDRSPGYMHVKLEPVATISGRVVFTDKKPAAGAIVNVASPVDPGAGQPPPKPRATARADQYGQYRITTLPAGKYQLWAELPGWFNRGIDAIDTKADQPNTIADLVLDRGSLIRARLVDADTNKPIKLDANSTTTFEVTAVPLDPNRSTQNEKLEPAKDGRFELRVLPDCQLVVSAVVEAGGVAKWFTAKPLVTNIAAGKTQEADIPVMDVATAAANAAKNPPAQQLPPPPPPPPPAGGAPANPATSAASGTSRSDYSAVSPIASADVAAEVEKKHDETPADAFLDAPVRVVDEAGRPVPGAVVEPSSFSAAKDRLKFTRVTDADGRTAIAVPRAIVEEFGIADYTVEVRHPGYQILRGNINAMRTLDRPSKLTLVRGGAIRIAATSAGWSPTEPVYGYVSDLTPTAHWTRNAAPGSIHSPQLKAGRHWLGAVAFPKDGPALFSDIVEADVVKKRTTTVEVALEPGWRVTGRLADDVPRPVTNGRVLLQTISKHPGIGWSDWTTVHSDGTFRFESLPRDAGAELRLTAVCNGFVSKTPDEAAKQYDLLAPQLFTLEKPETVCNLEMTPAAKCVVRVEDTHGQPLAGVAVRISPSVLVSGGTSSFGDLNSSKRMLVSETYEPIVDDAAFPYQATSDATGAVELSNLPPYPTYISAGNDNYSLPKNPLFALTGGVPFPIMSIQLQSGKTTRPRLALIATKPDDNKTR